MRGRGRVVYLLGSIFLTDTQCPRLDNGESKLQGLPFPGIMLPILRLCRKGR